MTWPFRVALAACAVVTAACAADREDAPVHERVAALDEAPLALLARDRSVLVASEAELARFDEGSTQRAHLTDGRYRECPWDPWQRWESFDSPPHLAPGGEALVLTTGLCGTWAWSIDRGAPVALSRVRRAWEQAPADPAQPDWSPISDVPVARDGDGWLACGRRAEGFGRVELWSLGPEGAPRGKVADLPATECASVHPTAEAIVVAGPDRLLRVDRASRAVATLHRSEVSYQDLRVLAAAPSYFAVTRGARFERVDDSGEVRTIAESTLGPWNSFSAAADATHLYWTDGERLVRAPHVDLTSVQELLPPREGVRLFVGEHPSVAVTSEAVWVVTIEDGRPYLARLPKPAR